MKFITAVLFSLSSFFCFAQNGYEIKVTLKPFKNQYIYLGHYYGKQLPIIDSAKVNEKSEAVFKGDKKLGGGIYLIGYPDRSHNFEILIDKNQKFSVVADTTKIQSIAFQNSPENAEFKAYQQFMMKNGLLLDSLAKKRRTVSPQDSVKMTAQMEAINEKIKKYRNDIIAKEGNSLLAALLKAMKEPDVPQNDPAAKTDSMFAYHYFKKHYWDGVNFYDDRLIRTPFFENRIDRYMDQLVYPSADSVTKELDYMLGFASINDEMQKFLLIKFVNRYLNQKYMWEDKVFVHLFENYFSNKTYPWLTEAGTKTITNRAYSLMANILGTEASDIELPDTSGKTTKLYSLQSPYTLVVIWDPTCSHCKEIVPKLDSAYTTKWRSMGLKFFAVARETDGKKSDWLNFIREHHLYDWTHVYYSKEAEQSRVNAGIPSYTQLYDVQSFPTLYLLDKDKRIIAKKLTLEQIDEILAFRQNNK
jgi:thiol-disulfide isomerase/thioredoxin